MVILSIVSVIFLFGVLILVPLGFREGDKPGDARVQNVEAWSYPRVVTAEITNPASVPVMVGISLRSPSLRLRLEGGTYARLRTRKTTRDLLPAEQTVIAVIDAGESQRFVIPADPGLGKRAALVVITGQPGRLRTIHRELRLDPVGRIAESCRSPGHAKVTAVPHQRLGFPGLAERG